MNQLSNRGDIVIVAVAHRRTFPVVVVVVALPLTVHVLNGPTNCVHRGRVDMRWGGSHSAVMRKRCWSLLERGSVLWHRGMSRSCCCDSGLLDCVYKERWNTKLLRREGDGLVLLRLLMPSGVLSCCVASSELTRCRGGCGTASPSPSIGIVQERLGNSIVRCYSFAKVQQARVHTIS